MQNESSEYTNGRAIEIIPAILVKGRADLLRQIGLVKRHAKTVQIDIMDNEFVPNRTIGIPELKGLPQGINYEFHWMVQQPENWIDKVKGGLHLVHLEANMDFEKVKKAVRDVGGRLGIAFNPETPIRKVLEYEKETDYFLAMTVHPGFSGQRYIREVEDNIKILRERSQDYDIEVDGGINAETIKGAVAAGANKIAAANAIFGQKNIPMAIMRLYEAALEAREERMRAEAHG